MSQTQEIRIIRFDTFHVFRHCTTRSPRKCNSIWEHTILTQANPNTQPCVCRPDGVKGILLIQGISYPSAGFSLQPRIMVHRQQNLEPPKNRSHNTLINLIPFTSWQPCNFHATKCGRWTDGKMLGSYISQG